MCYYIHNYYATFGMENSIMKPTIYADISFNTVE